MGEATKKQDVIHNGTSHVSTKTQIHGRETEVRSNKNISCSTEHAIYPIVRIKCL